MKSLSWSGESGADIQESEIPAEFLDLAKMYRDQMVEVLSEHDDSLMEKFIEGIVPTNEDINDAIRNTTISGKLFPVFCGTALKNKGVQPLLDAIVDYLPSPKDVKPMVGHNPKNLEELIAREASDKEPFTALVFKIMSDPYVGKLSYIRVYSGHVQAGDAVYNVSGGKRERIGRILRMHANDREDIKDLYTGDIAALVGIKLARTGDTLTVEESPILLERMDFPDPVISIAIEPKTKADQDKLAQSLKRLEEEDPTFRVKTDADTGQNIISGMGELHLDIIVDRLLREFNVNANVGKPQVSYKETITKHSRAEERYERQIGGKNQTAHVIIELDPLKPGTGFVFENKVSPEIIPLLYIPAIESGLRDAMEAGVLAGYRMADVKASLVGGSFVDNESTDMAYRIAVNIAFKEAARNAESTLLEPIMSLEVVVPDEYTGDIINDINSRRGRIEGIDMRNNLKVVDAKVPMSEMFGYATNVRSLSQGRASHTLQFSHYDIVPRAITDTLVARFTGRNF